MSLHMGLRWEPRLWLQAGLLGMLFDGNPILDSEQPLASPPGTSSGLEEQSVSREERAKVSFQTSHQTEGAAVPSKWEWELLQAAGRRLWTLQGSV